MATKKKVSKKVSKKAGKKAPAKKTRLSVKEKKVQLIGDYLEEIFHLAGHSIEAGMEESTPLQEILMIAMFLHNEAEPAKGRKIKEIKIMCQCKEKEHSIIPRSYSDDCMH